VSRWTRRLPAAATAHRCWPHAARAPDERTLFIRCSSEDVPCNQASNVAPESPGPQSNVASLGMSGVSPLWASAPSGPVWLGFAPPPPAADQKPGSGSSTGFIWKGWKSTSTRASPSVFLPGPWPALASRSSAEPSTSSPTLPLCRMANSPLLTDHGKACLQSSRVIGFPGQPRSSIPQTSSTCPWRSCRLLRARDPPIPGPTWGFQLAGGAISRHNQRRHPRSRQVRMEAWPVTGGSIPCR
jgi:hypothetical protein